LYSPDFLTQPAKGKGKGSARDRREVVHEAIHSIAQGHRYGYYDQYRRYGGYYASDPLSGDWFQGVTLDPRWLDAAVQLNDLEMVTVLARPKHPGTIQLLAKTMDEALKKKGSDIGFETSSVLETMCKIDHPKVVDYFLATLERVGKTKTQRYYYTYWLLRLIPDLPNSAAPKIEALVPSLNEKVIDEIVPYLEQLKAK
jgi:hypothetical protein